MTMMTNRQARHVFGRLNIIIQNLYDGDHKNEFYARGYQDGKDGGTAAINTFNGGKHCRLANNI